MTKEPTICLLSGGMDSTFALYWAMAQEDREVIRAVFFEYGQKGAMFEWQAAKKIADLNSVPITLAVIPSENLIGGILEAEGLPRNPHAQDGQGRPASFVPGRNLIHIAMLAPIVYASRATRVVGGWTSVDVEYPDCRAMFLQFAQSALTTALGREQDHPIIIEAPAMMLTKAEIIQLGSVRYNIPWYITRSCYRNRHAPCGKCDSCLVRARAFHANGMADPLYTPTQWNMVLLELEQQGYFDGQNESM